jgi:hypothetical protein
MTIKSNKKMEVYQITADEFNADTKSLKLFEDNHPNSFARLTLENISLKYAWNSRNILPSIQLFEESSLLFVAVDTYVRAVNLKKNTIDFSLNTETFFKWFDEMKNGLAIVTENEVIILNITNKCTLRKVVFFSDIIMGTKVDAENITVSFLIDEDKEINQF